MKIPRKLKKELQKKNLQSQENQGTKNPKKWEIKQTVKLLKKKFPHPKAIIRIEKSVVLQKKISQETKKSTPSFQEKTAHPKRRSISKALKRLQTIKARSFKNANSETGPRALRRIQQVLDRRIAANIQ